MPAGLGEIWEEVLEALRRVTPIYEPFNRVMSLGLLDRFRRKTVKMFHKCELILDAGSGPGIMSELFLNDRSDAVCVLLDPLWEMLKSRETSLRWNIHRVQGVFEAMPFRDCIFDGVVTAFSLRDARDILVALKEINRVLKQGGLYGLLDIGKPDFLLARVAVAVYFGGIVPLMALIINPSRWRNYTLILPTYLRLPKNGILLKMIKETMGNAFRVPALGGIVMISYAFKIKGG